MTAKPHVLIAGAGLGGLALALGLIQRGFSVDVFEQASELREFGAGINLMPNGNRMLDFFGVGAAVREVACAPATRLIRHWQTGQQWNYIDVGPVAIQRWGYSSLTVYRPDMHQAFIDAVEAARPGTIQLNARVIGCSQDERSVVVKFAGGREVRGDVLIGADGVHSVVRQNLFGADQPVFTGVMAWRGIIPMSRLPARFADIGTNAWLGPGRHSVQYPLRRGELLNFVGLVERDDWQVESWTERGTHAEWARDFPEWHADIQTCIRAVEVPYKWALIFRPPMPQWSVGRITLLGDACHSMLPFLAQGTSQALEDACVLVRLLQAAGHDIATALKRYEDLRRERTAKAVEGSAANAKRFHHPLLADPVTAETYIQKEFGSAPLAERMDWLLGYDAASVAL